MTNTSMKARIKVLKAEIASIEQAMARHAEAGIMEIYTKEVKVGQIVCRQVMGKTGTTLLSKPFPKFHEKWKVVSIKKERYGHFVEYVIEMRKVGSQVTRYLRKDPSQVITVQSV